VYTDRLLTKSCACGGTCPRGRSTERTLSRKAERSVESEQAPTVVYDVLNSPGRALDKPTRGFFEGGFGHDFGRIRVHADTAAARSARAVNAAAYTVGNHIVFDEGKYDPYSRQGRELIAHELTHTLQQDQELSGNRPIRIGHPADESERQADDRASAVTTRMLSNFKKASILQRQMNPAPSMAQPNIVPDLVKSASPFLAAAIGSVTIDGFITGKSDISATNEAKLAKTATRILSLLKQYPGSTIRVTGHTDAIGKENDNQRLGQARADSVQAALTSMGIPSELIQTESKGETQLLIKTDKAESRNRRVEVQFEPVTRPKITFPGPSSAPPDTSPKGSGSVFDWKLPPTKEGLPQIPPISPKSPPTLPPDFWKPIPAAPKRAGTSLDDKLNAVAHQITSFLPKSVQETAQELVKGALEKGVTSGLDSTLQSAGVDDKSRQAIGKAVEAALKQKIGGSP
jgi:outer membrane protein OmpA-like peptidoglycan-associated protein